MSDCIFCKIVNGEIPSLRIYEDDEVYAFLDIARDSYGHTLVIPKKHCVNVLDCDEKTLDVLMRAVRKIARHYTQNCGFDGVNLMNASGLAAQQSVFHLHFHIVPRKNGDGLNTWPLNEKYEMDLEQIQRELRVN